MVYNGKPTREWLSKDDAASPTASLEAIMLTAVIDAKEGRDVMTADIPKAFIQAKLPDIKDGEDRVILKITGVLVDLYWFKWYPRFADLMWYCKTGNGCCT